MAAVVLPLVLSLLVSPAFALLADNPDHNLLHNGDFELPGIRGRAKVVPAIGEQQHPLKPRSWVVAEGTIKYLRRDHLPTASGRHCIALNDNGSATIAQSFKTQPGASYFLFFNLAGDPGLENGAHRTLAVNVMAGTELLAERPFLIDTFRHQRHDKKVRWEEHSLSFTATESRAVLTFTSTTPGAHGPMIDNVRLFKRDALSGFFPSPNTAYNTGTILTVKDTSAEECARRCVEVPGCVGFTLRWTQGQAQGPCELKGYLMRPARVLPYNADSFIRKDVDCTFGHDSAKPCAQMLPGSTQAALVCLARRGWKRTKQHPFPGVCKPLQSSEMCHMFGGYFPIGMPAIGSGDDIRRCTCSKGLLGIAAMQCTKSM